MTIVFAMFFACATSLFALPKVEEVVNGEVDVQVVDNTMHINASNNTIINYQSFNIQENETVIVSLPSTDSQILNRVLGNSRSDIMGNLSCNGMFILINNSGVYVGPNANIDVQNLILSTRDMTDTDFLTGKYNFKKLTDAELDTLLMNAGTINIREGGFGVLIAGAIENRGKIIAPAGKIVLAAGDAIKLDIAGDGLISVAILEKTASQILDHEGNPITDQIKNTGELEANGGTVILKAEHVTDVFRNAINLEGCVAANRIEEKDGIIRIVANGNVKVSAPLEATQIEARSNTNIELNTNIISYDGDIALFADYDGDGIGSFRQIGGIIEATGEGNIYLDGSGEMALQTIKTELGAIKIGTQRMPDTIVGNPRYIHTKGDIRINAVEKGDDITTLLTDRGDVLRYATEGEVALEAETGSIIQADPNPLPGNYLEFKANDFQINSEAITTHLHDNNSDIYIEELIKIMENTVAIEGNGFGKVIYIETNNVTLQTEHDMDTTPGVIIPGNNVKIVARRIGSSDNPVGVSANLTYIKRIQGAIDVSEMWGLGSTIVIRGPDPHIDPLSWGAIQYNKGSDLVLEAENVLFSGEDSVYLHGNITFHNFSCTVPDKEIYFEAGKTYTFKGSLDIIGAPDQGPEEYYIKLRSQEEGSPWFLDVQSENYTLDKVNISDCHALDTVIIPDGVNAGNNTNLDIDPVWDGGSVSKFTWSTKQNWSGNTLPAGTDQVRFNATSTKVCVIDDVGTWSGGDFIIEAGYTGTITQNTGISFTANNFQQDGGTFLGGSGATDVTINGNFTQSGGSFTAPAGNLTFYGDLNRTGGTFTHNSGTVVFAGAGISDITGATDFYNLTCTTAAKTLYFKEGQTFTVNGTLTLTGTSGNEVVLDSQDGSTQFTIKVTSPQSVDYVDVSNSNVDDSGSNITANNSINGGNNDTGPSGAFWIFPAPFIDISGLVYSDQGSTLIGSGVNIVLVIDGVVIGNDDTDASSQYDFTNTVITATDVILVYINGHTTKGNTVTLAIEADIVGLDIYGNTVIARHDRSGPVTTAHFGTAKGALTDTDIIYSVSGADLALDAGRDLLVWTGDTYTPGGDISGADISIQSSAILNAASGSTITVSGDWINAGTFNPDTSLVALSGSGSHSVTSGGSSFNDLSTTGPGTYVLQDDLDVNGDLSITSGTLDANGQTINLAGDWNNSGVFTHNNNTVTIDGGGTSNVTGATTFYNLVCITPAKTILFKEGQTFTIESLLNIAGASGLEIILDSQDGLTQFTFKVDLFETLTYVNVSNSNVDDTGVNIVANDSIDGGNNDLGPLGAHWIFPVGAKITVAGDVYSDWGITPVTSGVDVYLIINGDQRGKKKTDVLGGYAFNTIQSSDGDAILVYVDNAVIEGNTVTLGNALDILDMDIYANTVIARHENAGPITNIRFSTAKGLLVDDDILYDVSGFDLTLDAGVDLITWGGDTYTPGGGVTANDLIIQSGAILNAAAGSSITLSGDWDNSGTFNADSSNVIFTGGAIANITGATTFNDLTCTTLAKFLKFKEGQTFTISGTLTLTGAIGNEIVLDSQDGLTQFTFKVTSPQSVDYINVSNSNVDDTGFSITANDSIEGSNVDVGPTGAYWIFPSGYFDIFGLVYSDQGSTLIGSGVNIILVINGTVIDNDDTNASSQYDFTSTLIQNDDVILVYINDNTTKGNTVTVPDLADITDLDIYGDTVIARHDKDGTVTNANFLAAKGSLTDIDIIYTVSGADLTLDAGRDFLIWTGKTYVPGGNLSGGDISIQSGAIFNAASGSTITASGDWVNTGTFNPDTSIVYLTGSGSHVVTSGGSAFNDLSITGSGTYALQDVLDVNGDLSIASGTLDANGQDINLAGDWDNSGTFTHSNNRVIFDGAGISNITGDTVFYDLICTTLSKELNFKEGQTFTIEGTLSLIGGLGQEIVLDSQDGLTQFTFKVTSPQQVVYVDVSNSNVDDTGFNITASDSINGGNNDTGPTGAFWVFPVGVKITISGTVYSDHGITPIGNNVNIVLVINGVIRNIKATAPTSAYEFKNETSAVGDSILVYIDNLSTDGNTITTSNAVDILDLDIYGGTVIARNETVTPLTNSNFAVARGTLSENDILFNVSGGNLTLDEGIDFLVLSGNTYSPGGDLSADSIIIESGATFNAAAGSTITFSGNWDNTGTFDPSTSTFVLSGTGTQLINSGGTGPGYDFYDLTISGSTVQLVANAIGINGTLSIQNGNTFDLNGFDITLDTLDNNGTLTLQGGETALITSMDTDSGAVEYTGAGTYTGLAAGDNYYDLIFSGTGVFNLDAALDVNGDMSITGNSSINSGANQLSIDGNYDQENGVFQAPSSNLTITGNFTRSGGTFDNNNGTIIFNASDTDNILDPAGAVFNNVTFTETSTYTLNSDIDINGTVTFSGATGYDFFKIVTIQASQVDEDLMDFPMLFSVTDADLATVANGGNVQSADGYDIIFTDANGVQYDHEIEYYDPVSGAVIAWVKVPVISSSVNTPVYLRYGDDTITTSTEDLAGLWGADYAGIWHMDDTSGLVSDSSQNANEGTVFAFTIGEVDRSAAGQIYIGDEFTLETNPGNPGYVLVGDNASLDITSELTLSAWVQADALGGIRGIVTKGSSLSEINYSLVAQGTELSFAYVSGGQQQFVTSGAGLATGQWYYVTATYNDATDNASVFINGSHLVNGTAVSPLVANDGYLNISAYSAPTYGRYGWEGTMDEVRVLNVARTPGWIGTEYNNQSSPATFYNISTGSSQTTTFALNGNNLKFAGDFDAKGSAFLGAGAVVLDGTSAQTLTPTGVTFPGLTVSNTSTDGVKLADNLTVSDTLTISSNAVFDLNQKNLTATGATVSNDGTFRLEGSETITGLVMDTDSGEVEYYGNDLYTGLAAGNYYYDLTFTGGGTYQLTADLDVNNDLTLALSDWYDASWSHRTKLSVDATKIPETVEDFTLYVDLSLLGTDFFNAVKADGTDIVVTTLDGVTVLEREVVGINKAGQTGELWFKADRLSSTADTIFYIYAGNAGANIPNDTDTWTSSYQGVWHFEDAGSDSTFWAHDLTNNGTVQGTGFVGLARDFSGGAFLEDPDGEDYINGLQEFTLSMWVKSDLTGTDNGLVTSGDPDPDGLEIHGIGLRYDAQGQDGGATDVIRGSIGVLGYTDRNQIRVESADSTQTTAWQNLALTWSSGDVARMYIDGVETTPSYTTPARTTVISSATKLLIGKGVLDTGLTDGWDGIIDETHLIDSTSSANRITTEYNNISDAASFFSTDPQAGSIDIGITGFNITIGGSLDTAAGEFSGAGTITFDDASRISNILGDTIFYNFNCTTGGKQLFFEAGSTQTILGAFTVSGTPGNLVHLASTSGGSTWNIDPQGTRSVSYADITDSVNISGTDIDATDSTGSGNTGWNITP
ncbi:DUF2341 domain-containing protein [Candidatus Omnitrophota bacterium]